MSTPGAPLDLPRATRRRAKPDPSRPWQSALLSAGTPHEQLRIERVIAAARLFLTVIVFLSFNFASVDPELDVPGANVLLVLFTAHSVSAMLVLRSQTRITSTFTLTTHTIDLLGAAITLPMAGPADPFFTFFLFVLAAAAFRWGLRETAITTVIAIGLVVVHARLAAALPFVASLGGPRNATLVVVQAAYLAMIGLLLGYLAEAGRLVRAEAAIIVGLLAKIRTDAGLARALKVVGEELTATFGAADIVLVVEDAKRQRLFRWDSAHGWATAPGAETNTARLDGAAYHFGQEDRSFAVVRRSAARSVDSRAVYRISAFTAEGRQVDATDWRLPDAFLAAVPFKRLIGAPIRLGDDWVGRVFVVDPKVDLRLIHLTRFLQRVVRQVGPAVFSVYLLERLRNRAGAIERARVARELHDGVIQALIGIEMQVDALKSSEPVRNSPLLGDMARIQGLLRAEVLSLRELMQQLRPDEFDPEELLGHLADMVQRFGRDTGLNARFTTDVGEVELPKRVCFELVRIVQEALVNIRKHSRAANVAVGFTMRDGSWALEISDDGLGFPFEGRLDSTDLDAGALGPAIIKERVRAIGGRLIVDSMPGKGARVEVLVPRGLHG